MYVQHTVEIFREVRRLLRKDGVLWLNIGDSYASGKGTCYNPGGGNGSLGKNRKESGAHPLDRGNKSTLAKSGLKPKDLVGIPWMVAFALRADGWYLRSDIIWHKPNPMPESVTDRPTKSHEYLFLMSKSQKYYYDAEAILEPYTKPLDRWGGDSKKTTDNLKGEDNPYEAAHRERDMRPNPNGRNRRSVWTITTKSFAGAHFATFPPDLIEPCIKAGSREGDTVLDPFCGSGTTGEVALKMNRNFVGIELNEEYVKKLIEPRLSQVNPLFRTNNIK
jgi:DNA modification methylase